MPDLVRVRDKNGTETTVSRDWLTRWPDDFELVESSDSAPAETTPRPAASKKKEA